MNNISEQKRSLSVSCIPKMSVYLAFCFPFIPFVHIPNKFPQSFSPILLYYFPFSAIILNQLLSSDTGRVFICVAVSVYMWDFLGCACCVMLLSEHVSVCHCSRGTHLKCHSLISTFPSASHLYSSVSDIYTTYQSLYPISHGMHTE